LRLPAPEVRVNALSGERVIVAPARSERPGSPGPPRERARPPEHDPACIFCPGNEEQTATELARLPDVAAGAWRVRVVANKYPALVEGVPQAAPVAPDELRPAESALGRHEVIVETPLHYRAFREMEDDELYLVLSAYRARFAAAAADERVRHVILFKNQGSLASATLEHPHSQLAALAFVPALVARRVERAREYRRRTGGSLLLDYVQRELADGVRFVARSGRFVALTPFAPSHAHEVWIVPARPLPRFDLAADGLLLELSRCLRLALTAVARALDDPDYNFILHTPPLAPEAESAWPFYGQIIPRRVRAAGFELGVGVQIVTTPPEESAAQLRRALEGCRAL
jgi:UDPglucose--hexose-1-phosphate uridylyltransferase